MEPAWRCTGPVAVGLLQAVGAVALDDALVAVALADAGHVHTVAGGEGVSVDLVAHVQYFALSFSVNSFSTFWNSVMPAFFWWPSLGLGELALGDGPRIPAERRS